MKTNQCPKEHLYIGENLIVRRIRTKKGNICTTRQCRECMRERNRINAKERALARKDAIQDGAIPCPNIFVT